MATHCRFCITDSKVIPFKHFQLISTLLRPQSFCLTFEFCFKESLFGSQWLFSFDIHSYTKTSRTALSSIIPLETRDNVFIVSKIVLLE